RPMCLAGSAKREVLLALSRVSTRVDGLRLTVMANAGDVAAESGARSVGSWVGPENRVGPPAAAEAAQAGARSVCAWVAHETRVDPPAAAADAKLAGLLEAKYLQVRAGVLSGRV